MATVMAASRKAAMYLLKELNYWLVHHAGDSCWKGCSSCPQIIYITSRSYTVKNLPGPGLGKQIVCYMSATQIVSLYGIRL